jgi:hypothetical protein
VREADERGLRAIRAAWRQEIGPDELVITTRILGDVPTQQEQVALRLAAAGLELLYQRGFVEESARMICERELQMRSLRPAKTFEEVGRAVGELVARIESHLGAFPARPWKGSGARETFLVGVESSRRDDVRWLIEVATEGSEAPEPSEDLVDMRLRAVGEDVGEVARFLDELAEEADDGAFRELVVELASGCRETVHAIRYELAIPNVEASARAEGAEE